MNPSAIYSKSGKGVQEASGKTSLLKRGDRAVLSAIDGRATLTEVAQKVGKSFDGAFEQLIRQLEKDGFVREVAAGAGAATTGSRPVVPPRPAPKAPPPAAKAPAAGGIGEDLDFTSIMPAVKPGTSAPPRAPAIDKAAEQRAKEQESALHKARQEAEARAQADRDRMRLELEAKTRAETEAKIRAETEKKVREEAEARLRAEADAKAKAARDAAVRLAAEAKAKAEAEAQARIEAERKAREEAERKAREEAEKARREAEELRQRLEEERRAREEVERKAREEAERKAREEAERKAREEAERKRKEEEERRRKEEEERRAREEAERKAREEAERQKREAEERKRREEEEERRRFEEEERARAAREAEERAREEEKRAREEEERAREEEKRARDEEERARKSLEQTKIRQPTLAAAPPPPPPPAARDEAGSLDSLMADLDSFSQREEDERAAREAAERKVRDEKKRKAQEESERRAKEEAEHERREAEARRRKQEEERREQEEAERRRREAEEQQRLEAEERKRKAQELLLAAKQAQEAASSEPEGTPASAASTASDDIGVTEDDLDMDDVRKDQAVIAKESRKQQREREREAKKREREARARAKAAAAREPEPLKYSPPRRPRKWGKPVAITLFLLLAAGIGALHVMPLPMQEYEQAASAALGRPVRIASGRLSLFTGVRLNLEGVRIGDSVRIASVHAYPELGSLFDERKAFNRIELQGMTIAQSALGETLFARLKGNDFSVRRILVKELKLDGPVPLPTFEAEAALGADGALRTATLRGPEELTVALTPSGNSVVFDGTASSFTLPFAPDVHLSSFAMKGVATTQGMNITAWGGSVLDGALTGTANLRWGGNWHMDGVVSIRGINAAVFAPALLSEGKAEGTGKFSMSGAEPAKLANGTRIDGSFTVNKGVLGSFDLPRAIQTDGRQYNGRTQFVEMTGQGVYDRGAVALRNVIISAGALSAGASADIAQSGALSGRIVADVKTAGQSLRQTLNLGGTVREPQVRN